MKQVAVYARGRPRACEPGPISIPTTPSPGWTTPRPTGIGEARAPCP